MSLISENPVLFVKHTCPFCLKVRLYLLEAGLLGGGAGHLAGNTIKLSHTEVPYDLQKTLEGATSTLSPLDADKIAESVRVMSGSLQGVPDALPEALTNLNSLAGVIQSRRDQLGTLITNADTIAALLHRQKADLGALVLQGNQILGEITTRRAAMQRLFDGVTLLADRGIDILSIPWLELVVFVVAAALVGVLAALGPARRAARMNVLESIAVD